MLIPSFGSRPIGPLGTGPSRTSLSFISPHPSQALGLGYPANLVSSTSAGERAERRQPYAARAYSGSLASMFSFRRICESPECSACNLDLNYPRRDQIAPYEGSITPTQSSDNPFSPGFPRLPERFGEMRLQLTLRRSAVTWSPPRICYHELLCRNFSMRSSSRR